VSHRIDRSRRQRPAESGGSLTALTGSTAARRKTDRDGKIPKSEEEEFTEVHTDVTTQNQY
jgi:hypothetical protein